MYIKFTGNEGVSSQPARTLCPFCGALGTFDVLGNSLKTGGIQFSTQSCPNMTCRGIITVIQNGSTILKTYPGVGKPINVDNVPDRIKDAFQEAANCYANGLYVAAAIMIRKTLEEICLDKGATGGNLYQKIENLARTIVIPQDLIALMHDLRLLGNDAAHLEAQTYNQISNDELDISIEFTQEIIKAIYQYQNLVARIRSLQQTPVTSPIPPVPPHTP